jgi:hypothetical protein
MLNTFVRIFRLAEFPFCLFDFGLTGDIEVLKAVSHNTHTWLSMIGMLALPVRWQNNDNDVNLIKNIVKYYC